MTSVETIALILVVLGTVKLMVLLIKPRAWLSATHPIWKSTRVITIVGLVLMLLSLKYLLTELNIVQIFACFGFLIPFMWIGFAPYREEVLQMVEKKFAGHIWKKDWLTTLIWLILMVWVLKEIF